MKNIFNILVKIIYGVIFIVLFVSAGIVIVSTIDIPGNYKLFVVMSGSMEPTLKKGAVVVVKPQAEYQKQDIITVKIPTNPKDTLTHRIVDIENKDDQKYFITKGDANDAPDIDKRLPVNILGKVTFSLPLIGYLISFTKTEAGLILFIIIPSVIIIYSELINIKNESQRLIAERKKRKLTLVEAAKIKVGKNKFFVKKGFE